MRASTAGASSLRSRAARRCSASRSRSARPMSMYDSFPLTSLRWDSRIASAKVAQAFAADETPYPVLVPNAASTTWMGLVRPLDRFVCRRTHPFTALHRSTAHRGMSLDSKLDSVTEDSKGVVRREVSPLLCLGSTAAACCKASRKDASLGSNTSWAAGEGRRRAALRESIRFDLCAKLSISFLAREIPPSKRS